MGKLARTAYFNCFPLITFQGNYVIIPTCEKLSMKLLSQRGNDNNIRNLWVESPTID